MRKMRKPKFGKRKMHGAQSCTQTDETHCSNLIFQNLNSLLLVLLVTYLRPLVYSQFLAYFSDAYKVCLK